MLNKELILSIINTIKNTITKNGIHLFIMKILVSIFIICFIILALYIIAKNKIPKNMFYNSSGELLSTQISNKEFFNKIKFGKNEEIINILDLGADINAVDEDGRNALILAALFNGKPEVANILSAYGIDINHKDINGYTALMMSILGGGNIKPFIDVLINNKANVNDITSSGISVLMIAVSTISDEKITETLLKNGAKVNYKNKDGVTALMMAAQSSTNPKIIEILLKYGANKKDVDSIGISIYEIALTNKALQNNKKLMEELK